MRYEVCSLNFRMILVGVGYCLASKAISLIHYLDMGGVDAEKASRISIRNWLS